MTSNHIEYSDALDLVELADGSICVKSNCYLKEGDLVATIPKQACLTIRTSGAAAMIEAAGLDGCLGLCVAVMYERSLGSESPWAGYLQILPFSEPLPLLWTLDEVDSLLRGTELHKVWFRFTLLGFDGVVVCVVFAVWKVCDYCYVVLSVA